MRVYYSPTSALEAAALPDGRGVLLGHRPASAGPIGTRGPSPPPRTRGAPTGLKAVTAGPPAVTAAPVGRLVGLRLCRRPPPGAAASGSRRKEARKMTVIEFEHGQPDRPETADHALARRLAEQLRRHGMPPRPWSSGPLTDNVRLPAERLMEAVQELHDTTQAAEERAFRADTLVAAFNAEQAGWAAAADGVYAVAVALAALRRLGVTVVLTTGDNRPRRGGLMLGFAW